MAQKLDDRELVSIPEALQMEMVINQALIDLLVEKGIITEQGADGPHKRHQGRSFDKGIRVMMSQHIGTSGLRSENGLVLRAASLRGLFLLALACTACAILPACAFIKQTPTVTEQQNYCHDPSSWTEWESLLQEKPGDENLRILYAYALRIGLCMLVERGELTTDQATEFFERQRDALIRAREPKQLGKPRI